MDRLKGNIMLRYMRDVFKQDISQKNILRRETRSDQRTGDKGRFLLNKAQGNRAGDLSAGGSFSEDIGSTGGLEGPSYFD